MNKTIDLALSGSGVRLGCHYGAILALRDKGYNIKRLVGVSGGAIIAAAYACYYPFEDIKKILLDINFNKLLCDGRLSRIPRLAFKNGLYKGDKFEKFIDNKITKGATLAEFPGLFIIAADLTDNKTLVLSSSHGYSHMKLSEAIRMSMSVPIYWVPKNLVINNMNHTIIDGGVTNNFPIDFFDDNLRPSIGISLYNKKKSYCKLKIINYFRNIIDTMMASNELEHIEDGYWAKTIKIDTGKIRPFDLDINSEQVNWCINRGYDETVRSLREKIEKES